MMAKNVVFLFCLFVFYACRQSPVRYSGDPVFPDTDTLQATLINADFIFDFPRQIALSDSLLVVRDGGAAIPGEPAYFHLFSDRGDYLGSFGRRGRGPGELLESTTLTFDRNGTAYAYDPASKKTVCYPLHDSLPCPFREFDMRQALPDSLVRQRYTRITDLLRIPAGNFLVIGNNDLLRFGIYTGQGSVRPIWNTYPQLTAMGTPAEVWSIFNSSAKYRLAPDGSKLACATYVGAVLDCYSVDNDRMERIGTYRIYEPVYKIFEGVTPTQITRTDRTVIGFEDLDVTNRYIYGLLNGCFQGAYAYPDRIVVFDWEGRPVRSYHVDMPLCKIAVDDKRGVIYALTASEGEPCRLVRFDLPDE